MSRFTVFYAIFLALILGFLLGTYRQHSLDFDRIPGLIKHDMTVSMNRGFVIGCEAGIRGFVGVSASDPTEPIWLEWCVKSVGHYINQSETK